MKKRISIVIPLVAGLFLIGLRGVVATAQQAEIPATDSSSVPDPEDEQVESTVPKTSATPIISPVPNAAGTAVENNNKPASRVRSPHESAERADEKITIKFFHLKNADAVECVEILQTLKLGSTCTFAVDQRTNSLIVQSYDIAQVAIIEALLLQLDEVPTKTISVSAPVIGNSNFVKKSPRLSRERDAKQVSSEKTERDYESPSATSSTESAGRGEASLIKVYTMQFMTAEECVQILKSLDDEIKVSVDSRTNSVILVGSHEQLKRVSKLIQFIEAASSRITSNASRSTSEQLNREPMNALTTVSSTSDPQARALVTKLSRLETQARTLAQQIRNRTEKQGDNPEHTDQRRRELDETLSAALAAKFNLEQLQVNSLEDRLARLKTQMARRAASVKQIVDRRSRELIEGDASQWTPTVSGVDSESTAKTTESSLSTEPATKVSESESKQLTTSSRDTHSKEESSRDKLTQEENEGERDFFPDQLARFRELVIKGNTLSERSREIEKQTKKAMSAYLRATLRGDELSIASATENLHCTRQAAYAVRRNHELTKDEFNAMYKDLSMQIEGARDEQSAAKTQLINLNSLVERDQIPQRQFEAQKKHSQAGIAVARLLFRQELFGKWGYGIKNLVMPFGEQQWIKILVAKEDLEIGIRLEQSNVEYQEWPKDLVSEAMITKDEEFVDQNLKVRIAANMPILKHCLRKNGEDSVSIGVLAAMQTVAFPQNPSSFADYLAVLRNSNDIAKLEQVMRKISELRLSGKLSNVDDLGNRSQRREGDRHEFPGSPTIADSQQKEHHNSIAGKSSQSPGCERLHDLEVLTEAFINSKTRVYASASQGTVIKTNDKAYNLLTELNDALTKTDRSVKGRVILKILRAADVAEKRVAVELISPLWEHYAEPYFPELSQELLKAAEETDIELRYASLRVVIDTLPITSRGPTGFNTPERQEMARQVSAAVPRDRINQLLKKAFNEKSTDVLSLNSKLNIIELCREQIDDDSLTTQMVDLLLQIVRGEFDNVSDVPLTPGKTLKSQLKQVPAQGASVFPKIRKNALGRLVSYKSKAAIIVPKLIDLLKADKSDFQLNGDRFTRGHIAWGLQQFGAAAKDAIPVLEDELILLKSKATSKGGADHMQNDADYLKQAIDNLKASLQPK